MIPKGIQMDLTLYSKSDSERCRIENVLRLIPATGGASALDVGTRDGYFSKILAEKYDSVIALDLKKPSIDVKNVRCVQGNVTCLQYEDNSFDLVLCTEVLEHIPQNLLEKACAELSRVSKKYLLIGVPYKQDIRLGRTTCCECGRRNPPWGHVSTFDENRLKELFSEFHLLFLHYP